MRAVQVPRTGAGKAGMYVHVSKDASLKEEVKMNLGLCKAFYTAEQEPLIFKKERYSMKKSLFVASLFAVTLAAHAQSPAGGSAGASPSASGTSAATPPSSGSAQPGGPRGSTDKSQHGRQHGQMDAQKMIEHHITSLDTDKDGKVSRQEFLARQSEAFSKADGNADGYVTKEELAAQHQKNHAEMAASRDARRAARGGPSAEGAGSGAAGSAAPGASGGTR